MENRKYAVDEISGLMNGNSMILAYIPRSIEEYESGKGERVHILVDQDTRKKYHARRSGIHFYGMMLSLCGVPKLNSLAFDEEMKTMSPVEFEMRGKGNPVLSKRVLEEILIEP